jgi:hypothetical protein
VIRVSLPPPHQDLLLGDLWFLSFLRQGELNQVGVLMRSPSPSGLRLASVGTLECGWYGRSTLASLHRWRFGSRGNV